MRIKHIWILRPLLFGLLLITKIPAMAQQEKIVFDSLSGNYIVTSEYEGQLYQTIFVPGNKIKPSVKSKYKLNPKGDIEYRYKVRNGKESQQHLQILILIASNVVETSLRTPEDWNGSVAPEFGGFGFRVWWSYWGKEKNGGLPPGASLKGFGFESPHLPGIGHAALRGATPILKFKGYGPSQEISDQLAAIRRSDKDSVPLPVAMPRIPVPDPFDATVVLQGIQAHVQELVGMELVESVFASQLDRLLQAAVDAVKQGNLDATRGDIKDARHLIKKEHTGLDKDEWVEHDKNKAKGKQLLIAKLAAKVLDFDLRYVEKRMKKGK